MSQSIELIICTEPGFLENQAKLLVYSLRKFGGIHSQIPIYSYNPRGLGKLSTATLDFFDAFEVSHDDRHLNKEYYEDPFFNKAIASADRESNSSAEWLLWLDSDMVFLKEPTLFNSIGHSDHDIYLRPVDNSGIGVAEDFSGKEEEYWRNLYNTLDIKTYRTIFSSIDNRKILEYYNGGFILTRRAKSFMCNYLENLKRLWDTDIRPKSQKWALEQSSLGATVSAMQLDVGIVGKGYNCPYHLNADCRNPEFQIKTFTDVTLLHYHRWFKESRKKEIVKEFKSSESGIMILEKMNEWHMLKETRKSFLQRFFARILA